MRVWLPILMLLLAAHPGLAATPIPGPLGQGTGRVQGTGKLVLTFLPKDEGAPVQLLGKSVPAMLVASAVPAQVEGHPYEIAVAVTPLLEGAADLAHPYIRCATVAADAEHQVPATAISSTIAAKRDRNQPEADRRVTYSVARTRRVAVGVVDLPTITMLAGVTDPVGQAVPASTFALSLATNDKLRFYAEAPFRAGTLALTIEVLEWSYVPAR